MTYKRRADSTGDEATCIERSDGGFGEMFVILVQCVDVGTLVLVSRVQICSGSCSHLKPIRRTYKAIGREVGQFESLDSILAQRAFDWSLAVCIRDRFVEAMLPVEQGSTDDSKAKQVRLIKCHRD